MLNFLLRILGFLPEKRAEVKTPTVEPKNTQINAVETVAVEMAPANPVVEIKAPAKRGRKPRQTTGKKSKV